MTLSGIDSLEGASIFLCPHNSQYLLDPCRWFHPIRSVNPLHYLVGDEMLCWYFISACPLHVFSCIHCIRLSLLLIKFHLKTDPPFCLPQRSPKTLCAWWHPIHVCWRNGQLCILVADQMRCTDLLYSYKINPHDSAHVYPPDSFSFSVLFISITFTSLEKPPSTKCLTFHAEVVTRGNNYLEIVGQLLTTWTSTRFPSGPWESLTEA